MLSLLAKLGGRAVSFFSDYFISETTLLGGDQIKKFKGIKEEQEEKLKSRQLRPHSTSQERSIRCRLGLIFHGSCCGWLFCEQEEALGFHNSSDASVSANNAGSYALTSYSHSLSNYFH